MSALHSAPHVGQASAKVPTRLQLILPCYHPPQGWIERIAQALPQLQQSIAPTELHLAVVNDGDEAGVSSADRQRLESIWPHVRYIIYPENRGKGYALRTAAAQTEGDYYIYTDIDLPYTLDSVLAVYQAMIQSNATLVAGERDAAYYADVPWRRRLISKLFRLVLGLMFRIPVQDTQCGLKGFNQAGRQVFLQTRIDRYLFDLEFIYLVSHTPGLSVISQPVVLRPGVEFSRMNAGVLIQEFRNLLGLRLRRIRRTPRGG